MDTETTSSADQPGDPNIYPSGLLTLADQALLPFDVVDDSEAWGLWSTAALSQAHEDVHGTDGECEANEELSLYVYTDHLGRALYVGITNSVTNRFRSHHRSSDWTKRATSCHWHSDVCCRAVVLHMETAAIHQFHPQFNRAKVMK